MEQRAAVGTIGLHDACDEYGPADRGHLVTFGMTRGGAQRYRCKVPFQRSRPSPSHPTLLAENWATHASPLLTTDH